MGKCTGHTYIWSYLLINSMVSCKISHLTTNPLFIPPHLCPLWPAVPPTSSYTQLPSVAPAVATAAAAEPARQSFKTCGSEGPTKDWPSAAFQIRFPWSVEAWMQDPFRPQPSPELRDISTICTTQWCNIVLRPSAPIFAAHPCVL